MSKRVLGKDILGILLLATFLAALYLYAGMRWFRLARVMLVVLTLAAVSLPPLFRVGKDAWKHLLSPKVLVSATALSAMAIVYTLQKGLPVPHTLAFEALVLLAGVVFFAGFRAFLEVLRGREPDRIQRHHTFLLIAGISLAVLAIGWLPYFPHGISPDTQDQWAQIHGQIPYSNIHAIGHTILLRALLSIYDNYTIVIAFYILALSTFNGVLGAYLVNRGAPIRIVLWMVGIVGLTFSSLSAVYFPWKDLPAALCLGVLTLFAMRLADTELPPKPLSAVLLGAALAFAWLFRHNGLVALAIFGVYFIIVFMRRGQWLQIACMSLACVVSIVGVHLYAGKVLRTQYGTNPYALQFFGSGLAAIALEANLTEVERAEVEELLPMDWIHRNYKPWQNEKLIWKKETVETAADASAVGTNPLVIALTESGGDIVRLYLRLLPRNFGICLKDVLYNNFALYGIFTYDLAKCNGLWALLVLFAIAVLWSRDMLRRHWTAPAAIFINMASIAVSTITNEVRYFLPTFLLFGGIILYATTVIEGGHRKEETLKKAPVNMEKVFRRRAENADDE